MLAIELSKENLELSYAEVILHYDILEYECKDNILFCDIPRKDLPRFAYVKNAYEPIARALTLSDLSIPILQDSTFFIHGPQEHMKTIASLIWDKTKNPSISKEGTEYHLKKIENEWYLLKKVYHNDNKLLSRVSSKYPVNRPISLKPRLARCCVNMLGQTERIIDPFVGIGTFMVEAGLLGMFTVGFDNDYDMIKATRTNLAHFGVKNYVLKLLDSTSLNFPLENVVTDLPYGKNTKNIPSTLYKDFFSLLGKHLQRRAIIIVRDPFDTSLIPGNLKLIKEFTQYIHSNLTRRILVLEKIL